MFATADPQLLRQIANIALRASYYTGFFGTSRIVKAGCTLEELSVVLYPALPQGTIENSPPFDSSGSHSCVK